ncbi:MAG: sigma-54 dependent transcriptional regulator [Gammaproteobacteria bacterium]|jgi:two-component system response regulator PilR (NtrC family)|nr:sigma-54 dependent transcriptional regulator [Gammaproteobacteria bacterium]
MNKPLALVVDDEPDICELLAITLERMGIRADTCGDVAAAQEHLLTNDYDLCLTDMRLPDGDGLELVQWMQRSALRTPVAVITAHGNVETAVRALKVGAFDFISKPVDLHDLRKLVDSAMRLDESAAEQDGLVGQSPAMARVREVIAKVARSQAPVFISGESGTGKELVAAMIHQQGPRQSGPFVPVNCGAIPTELMESEFFGHKKGAFTGAVADQPGLFRSAEGGTLFLDEIADLPLHMQVKLLRVIQEKKVRPIGGQDELPVDVRILSASHKDLAALVSSGAFREDLYYRINVIELPVPPLRERAGDVLLLARHILQKLALGIEMSTPRLDKQAEAKLSHYRFPGNVRELENILERAITLCDASVISADDIQVTASEPEPAGAVGADLGRKLDSVERDTIVKALETARYNKTAAARQLGITLRALRYRMQKLGIE